MGRTMEAVTAAIALINAAVALHFIPLRPDFRIRHEKAGCE